MKTIFQVISLTCVMLTVLPASRAADVVELKLPNANKVVIKLMFRNGSICDPAGKEGLTALTSNLILESGFEKMTHAAIQEMMYPWAASMSVSVDKEVSVFTFEVPKE